MWVWNIVSAGRYSKCACLVCDLLRFTEILLRFTEIYWDLLRFTEIYWDLLRFTEILLRLTEIYWDLLSCMCNLSHMWVWNIVSAGRYCMSACLVCHVCVCTCMYMHIHIHTHTYALQEMYIYIFIYICTHTERVGVFFMCGHMSCTCRLSHMWV